MGKYVLILGASSLQVPLIALAKKKGYLTIVVSISGDYPGFELADVVLNIDIRDGAAIFNAVKNYQIEAVITDQTDISVPTVAYLSKRLNLPGNGWNISNIYSNKYLMREFCQNNNIPIPSFCHVRNKTDVKKQLDNIHFPAIMKPEDSQGSRGVYMINSEAEIYEHLNDSLLFSSTGMIIIEDFFKGHEIVCEGFVKDGEYLNWGIADRKYFKLSNTFIPSQTIFPSLIPDSIKDKILECERIIHSKLNPSFGMIHSEYLVDLETGDFILEETALRGGGVYISSHLVPLYTGINNYELLFGCALGKKCDLKEIKRTIERKSSAYICYYLPEGTVISIEGIDKIRALSSVKLFDSNNISIGQKTKTITNKTQRLGPIIISADSRDIVEKEIEKCKEFLNIEVETIKGIKKGIVWD